MLLQKGQKIKLLDIDSDGIFTIKISVQFKKGMADITCFGVDEKNKLSDDRYFVFYNQTASPNQAIVMEELDKETNFHLSLKNLPSAVKKLVFTIAVDGDFSMKEIESGSFSLWHGSQKTAEYSFDRSQFMQEKAIILCEIYEKEGVWRLSPVANGFYGGLSALLAFFWRGRSGFRTRTSYSIRKARTSCHSTGKERNNQFEKKRRYP